MPITSWSPSPNDASVALLAVVMGPGGYRFSDYLRVGVPLNVVVGVVTVVLAPLFWPF